MEKRSSFLTCLSYLIPTPWCLQAFSRLLDSPPNFRRLFVQSQKGCVLVELLMRQLDLLAKHAGGTGWSCLTSCGGQSENDALYLLFRGLEAGLALVPSHSARDGFLSCRATRLPLLGVANARFAHLPYS